MEKSKRFDFLIGGEFLRGTLEELVLRHEALKANEIGDEVKKSLIGVEELVEIEYVESCPPRSRRTASCMMIGYLQLMQRISGMAGPLSFSYSSLNYGVTW